MHLPKKLQASNRTYHRPLCLLSLLLIFSAPALAQYKWVAQDGTVSYSDMPPPPAEAKQVEKMRLQTSVPGVLDGLPYTLKRLATVYPVVMYSQIACAPCDAARAHLKKRGVPYTEQVVKTQADINAMTKSTGDQSLPTVLVGKTRLRGYLASELDAALDSAGYPKTSMMPATWQAPAPRSPSEEAGAKKPVAAADKTATPDANTSSKSAGSGSTGESTSTVNAGTATANKADAGMAPLTSEVAVPPVDGINGHKNDKGNARPTEAPVTPRP